METLKQPLTRYRLVVGKREISEAVVEVDAADFQSACELAMKQALAMPSLVWHPLGSSADTASGLAVGPGGDRMDLDSLLGEWRRYPIFQVSAGAEGWALFNTDTGRADLQRDDEMGVFASDDEALEFVRRGTKAHHQLAIRILYMQGDLP